MSESIPAGTKFEIHEIKVVNPSPKDYAHYPPAIVHFARSIAEQAVIMFLYLEAAKKHDPAKKSIRVDGEEFVIS